MIRLVNVSVCLAVIAAVGRVQAQTPADAHAAVDPSSVRQTAAASAMGNSLARQRASLQKQSGQTESGKFFVLPPPARLGANFPAPAAFESEPAVFAPTMDCDPLPASEVDSLVAESARDKDVDEDLLRGVMRNESAFRPCAVSSKGAMGLMQLMPATASQFGVPNPFDPKGNVEAGASLLKQLLVRYGGDLPLALGAYNAGPAKVDAAAGVPDIPETQAYVKRILSNLPAKH